MKSFYKFCVVILFCWGSLALASTIHVPGDYPTIQGGIDAASEGDTVLVDDGTYIENIDFMGKAIAVMSENGPISTIIHIALSGVPVVYFHNDEGRNSVIQGFTISGDWSYWGVYCVSSSPLIYNNIIKNHETGVRAVYGSPLIRRNEISHCDHSDIAPHKGGAVFLEYSSNAIVDSNFAHHNGAHVAAGMDFSFCSNILIERNLIMSNTASDYIGGLVLNNCNGIDLLNNTIVKNVALDLYLGSVTFHHCEGINIVNNICSFNQEWGILDYGANSGVTVDYNDAYNNVAGDIGGLTPGPNNVYEDPLFVDLENDDYHLQAESPCIDAGDPASPLDPDGTIADMGAYYYFAGTTTYGLTIASTFGENGQPVDLPVIAYGLENQEIAGVELHIDYDEACLEYNDFSSDYLADALVNVVDGEIHILWEDYLSPIVVPDSAAMLDLQFTVLGQLGDNCSIAWLEDNELVDSLGEAIEDLTFVDGSVNVVEFHDISGNVVYYDLLTPVADVTVELTGDYGASDITGENGAYGFEDLFPGEFTICPSRSEDDAGVTVTDIVLIRRHIVWLELFDTPYKLIAADVNESGGVSVADVIKMRRYLAELDELPGGNWTFVDSSFVITDENWPVAPGCMDVSLWDADLTDSSFVGIRMGDVDYSWAQGRLGIPPPKVTDTAVLDLMDCYGQPGETVQMPINVSGFSDVAGLELHIEFPSEGMSFIGFGSDVMADPTTNGTDGEIHFVWEDIFNVVSLEDGEEVVSIAFEISEDASDSMLVSFTAAYVVDEEGIDFIVDSRAGYVLLNQTPNYGDDIVLPESYRLSQNYPNPFNAGTVIEFDLPEQSYVAIEIYDLLGRRVETIVDQIKEAGYHQVTWNAVDQPSGIYFFKIEASDFAQAKKMLLLK